MLLMFSFVFVFSSIFYKPELANAEPITVGIAKLIYWIGKGWKAYNTATYVNIALGAGGVASGIYLYNAWEVDSTGFQRDINIFLNGATQSQLDDLEFLYNHAMTNNGQLSLSANDLQRLGIDALIPTINANTQLITHHLPTSHLGNEGLRSALAAAGASVNNVNNSIQALSQLQLNPNQQTRYYLMIATWGSVPFTLSANTSNNLGFGNTATQILLGRQPSIIFLTVPMIAGPTNSMGGSHAFAVGNSFSQSNLSHSTGPRTIGASTSRNGVNTNNATSITFGVRTINGVTLEDLGFNDTLNIGTVTSIQHPITSLEFHRIHLNAYFEGTVIPAPISVGIPRTNAGSGIIIPDITADFGTRPLFPSGIFQNPSLPLDLPNTFPNEGITSPDLSAINLRLDLLETTVGILQNENVILRNEMNNAFLTLHNSVNGGFAALQGNVLGINEGIEGLNNRIGDLELGIGNVNTGIQGLNNRIGGLETGIGNINTGIQGIGTDIAGVNQGIQGIDQRIGNLEGTLTGGLAGVTSAINTLPATISTAVVGDFSKINFNAFFDAGLLMTDRFPFSIPWDFQNLINVLNVAPRPPVFEFDFNGTIFEGFDFRLDLYEMSSTIIFGNATVYMLVNTIRHILSAFFANALIILTMKIFK